MTIEERILAWLGQWRDSLPLAAIAALQDIVAPASLTPLSDGIATPEEWDELDAIGRLRGEIEAALSLDPVRLPPDVQPTPAQLERVRVPLIDAAAIGVALHDRARLEAAREGTHVCDRSGPLVPLGGEYRFTCSTCSAPQEGL